ncbi:MAG: GSCFA domain-containing protein [Bacteroidaceae bacterium]|nr:GSCFA domain-containing protein [Bacteroidaceae bacterium]
MFFTTPVELPCGTLEISHRSRLMLIGSCFADNIGTALLEKKFNVDVNPFGVQYNPLSIATVLSKIVDGAPFCDSSPELFEHNGKWHSILHHSDFSRSSRTDLIESINKRLIKAHNAIEDCDTIIITLGTAYAYRRNSDNSVVGNCHKLPGNCFTRSLLEIEDIVENISTVMQRIAVVNPKVKFIFTVSPIRHLRDGANDNQKSKATLLLAIDRITQRFPENTAYFPSYEIMMDELRDYRFYADDMLHPSAKAIEYIWKCFDKCYFNAATRLLNTKTGEISRGLAHRPFDPDSDTYKQFISQLLNKIEAIEKEHPYIDFENERTQCNTLLNR